MFKFRGFFDTPNYDEVVRFMIEHDGVYRRFAGRDKERSRYFGLREEAHLRVLEVYERHSSKFDMGLTVEQLIEIRKASIHPEHRKED